MGGAVGVGVGGQPSEIDPLSISLSDDEVVSVCPVVAL